MKRHKRRNKSKVETNQTSEELVYQTAEKLAADMGISFSEALGFTLGIENPTYGWEEDLSEEELQELINNSCGSISVDDEVPDSLF